MPKKPTLDVDEIYEGLKHMSFIKDRCYLPFTSTAWSDTVQVLQNKIQKSYLYQYVTGNRNELSSRIHEFDCSDIPKRLESKNRLVLDESNWSMDNSKHFLDSIRATIHMNLKQWHDLGAHFITYNDEREYEVLEPGWTGRIYSAISNNYRLPCPFTFKNVKINRNPGEIYLTIKGKCPECENEIHLYCTEEPNAHGLNFHISTLDTTGVAHKKKRQLRGTLRKEIVQQVRSKSILKWRLEEANKLMDFNDCEPANLYSSEVLRKAKQQQIDKELGTGPTKNPVIEVANLKLVPEFSGSIHEVSYNKFYVMYWTLEQREMYKKLLKECAGVICIDATGSLIKSLPSLDGSKRIIFLYQAIGIYKNETLPIFQMLSEKHDANTLQYWIGEWLRSGVKIPKQVVSDFSLALLNACSVGFNQKSLKNYIADCYEQATLKVAPADKMTVLRIDIAHLIHFVSRWPCFSKDFPHVKDFFLKSIGILSQTSTIDEFRDLCIKILVIAKQRFGDMESPNDAYNLAQKHLLGIMKKGYSIPEKEENIFAELTEFNDYDHLKMPKSIESLVLEIETKSSYENSGIFLNPYYCPDFAKRLLKLCTYFLLWTSIMPFTYFASEPETFQQMRIASSARCEAYFKDLKKLIFEEKKSVRVDKVIIIHLRSLAGITKLLCAHGNSQNNPPKPYLPPLVNASVELSTTVDSDLIQVSDDTKVLKSIENNSAFLNEVDSWKGLLKNKPKRGFHFRPSPDIENIHKRAKKLRNLPLLVNGSSSPPVKIDRNVSIKVNNTCGFDALIHCIRAGYTEWIEYTNYINESTHSIFKFVKLLSSQGTGLKIYKLRAKLLLTSFRPKDGVVDCMSNVGTLIQTLMDKEPSVIENTICRNCDKKTNILREIISPDLMPMYSNGLSGLQESLHLFETDNCPKKCSNCMKVRDIEILSGAHLIIDIEALQWNLAASRSQFNDVYDKVFTLDEVPIDISFCGYHYKLTSAIVHIPGHYIPYIRCISGNWEKHDGICKSSKVQKAQKTKKMKIHILFYARIK